MLRSRATVPEGFLRVRRYCPHVALTTIFDSSLQVSAFRERLQRVLR